MCGIIAAAITADASINSCTTGSAYGDRRPQVQVSNGHVVPIPFAGAAELGDKNLVVMLVIVIYLYISLEKSYWDPDNI